MHTYAKNSFQHKQLLKKLQRGEDPDKLDKNRETPLIIAVKNKNYIGVSILLSYKADPDLSDRFQSTPLHWSCIANDYNLTEILLKNNANLNVFDIKQKTPLDYILQEKKLKILKLIKNYLSSNKIRRLIVKYLHKKQYDIVENLVCFRSLKNYECEILNTTLLQDDSYSMFKTFQILYNTVPILFIDTFWINKILTKCIELEKNNCLTVILPYVKNINLSDKLESGDTLLHVAAYKNNQNAIEQLLNFGANPRLRNCDYKLPIHFATKNFNIYMIRYLSKYYFDPNLCDINGECFLEYLIETRNTDLCLSFIKETNLENLYRSMWKEIITTFRLINIVHFSLICKNIQYQIFKHWMPVIIAFEHKTNKRFKEIGMLVKTYIFKL